MAYYELLKEKKEAGEHKLRIAAIFSYQANDEDSDANGFIEIDIPVPGVGDSQGFYQAENKHSREKLDDYIDDYNEMFNTNYSTDSFYSYY